MRIPRYETYRRLLIEPARSVWVRGLLAAGLMFVAAPAIQVFGDPAWIKWAGTGLAVSLAIYLLATLSDPRPS